MKAVLAECEIVEYIGDLPICRVLAPTDPPKLSVLQCPKCGSNSVVAHKYYMLKSGVKKCRFKCGYCRKTFSR